MMKKIEQLMLLATCLAIMVVAALQRDGSIWGHRPADTAPTTEATPDTARAIQTMADGTLVINTTTLAPDIMGYGGRVPLEVSVKDGKVVRVEALPNSETPEFFSHAATLLKQWNGKTVDDALAQQVDAVSGATFSSRAIIANMRAALQQAASVSATPTLQDRMDLRPKTIAGLIVVLMGAVVPLFYRRKAYRYLQLGLNTVVLGLWGGTFLNWSMFVAFCSGGIDLWMSLIPVVMLVTAFVYPLFGKKNHYCTHICPFGSVQELAGKATKRKWKPSQATVRRLNQLRQALFAVLMVLMLTGTGFQWMDYELFSAFIFQSASVVVIVMAVVFVVLSVFVTRPYCRFVCPTGTLFKLAEGNK